MLQQVIIKKREREREGIGYGGRGRGTREGGQRKGEANFPSQ